MFPWDLLLQKNIFLMKVIFNLLKLFAITKVKENKSRVSSCTLLFQFSVLYVVSQHIQDFDSSFACSKDSGQVISVHT
jgi:hypothetical protein